LVGSLFAAQFFTEGLHRTKYLPILGLGVVILACTAQPFTERLPLAIQRSLTIFPVNVDPIAARDAKATLEWRVEMWKLAVQDIPKYFWVGKGYAINPTDLYLAGESVRRGQTQDFIQALVAGDYHNGPLSVQLPFGVFGSALILWFFGAGIWALRRNATYGDPAIQKINNFLLACFVARAVYFLVFFGAIFIDLMVFTGILGLSASLNRGVRSKEDWIVEAQEEMEPVEQEQALSA
jgi:hypothetical protein